MADANAYFAANPDVAASYLNNSYGLTPEQFATAHYNLYGATEQRAAPTVTAEVPASVAPATPSLPPPPTWMDAYNKWNVEQNLPERAAKGYTTPDMWAWNTDEAHQKVKDLLDKQYLENLRQYNATYGTNIQPDASVLGANAQPNQTYYTPDEDGGLFGGGGFLGTGIGPNLDLTDVAKVAALYYGGTALAEALGSGALAATPEAAGTTLLDYSVPTSTGGLGLKGAAALDGTLASGLAAPAAGSLGGGLGLTAGAAANLAAMGGAQGLLANAAGGGVLGETGVNTGLLAASNLTPSTSSVVGTTGATTGLTPTQVANIAKAGVGLLGGAAAAGGMAGLLGGGGVTLPTQNRAGISSGSAQYSPEYYAAIQAKYNQMMPQQPRDVTTELKNWYETKYAPKVTQ